jgi:hypothetical protein
MKVQVPRNLYTKSVVTDWKLTAAAIANDVYAVIGVK